MQAIFLLGAALLQAGAVAPIDRVVVFADRAEVTRLAEGQCRAGRAEAVFGNLPVGLDVRTLRAEAAGKSRVIGTFSRVVEMEDFSDQRVAELKQQILKLELQQREIAEQKWEIRERLSLLDAYGAYFLNLASEQMRAERPALDLWARVLENDQRERLEAVEKSATLETKLRQLRREIDRLNRRLSHLNPNVAPQTLEVTAAVECIGENRTRVSLAYVVAGATWQPEYDLRFLPDGQAKVGKGRAELTVGVVVRQATGEDWQDVRLVLSTSKPRLGAESPYPAALQVSAREIGKEKVLVQATERRESLAGPAAAEGAGPQAAALEDRGQSFALTLPHRATVLSDGRPYWMPLDSAQGPAEALLLTIPKARPYVYQVVRLKNPASYPLIEGRVHVHRRGAYVGDTYTRYRAPGEPMELSLGIDEEFSVDRRSISDINRSPGFLSSTRHLEQSWRIGLTNKSSSRQTVTLRENIPVSKTEDVRVELNREKTTSGFELDEHRGFVDWKTALAPGETKNIELHYVIHLPEDWKIGSTP